MTATSTGGRDGSISSTPTDETAPLNLKLTLPKAIGGRGDSGHNPEQLFAAGYSGKSNYMSCYAVLILKKLPACFLGALQAAAAKQGKREVGARAVVHADVSLGLAADRPGFGLKVVLRVEGVEDQAILDAAHEVSYVIQLSQPLKLMALFHIDMSIQSRFARRRRGRCCKGLKYKSESYGPRLLTSIGMLVLYHNPKNKFALSVVRICCTDSNTAVQHHPQALQLFAMTRDCIC